MTNRSSSHNEMAIDKGHRLKHLTHWPAVNIKFEEIIYTVDNEVDNKSEMILKNLSGCFSSGQLTAIMGPSGSGKTTLLNSLAGFRSVAGSILVNNVERDMKTFRRMSRYIMQQDVHQEGLTVHEVLMYAADLKLGFKEVSKEQKLDIIEEIVGLLRLEKTVDTLTSNLSGGELKRLSIAQELVNNPPVLFLDEPTTGLDDTSSSQCVDLLRRLAREGRTVICSIHTPSAKIFEMFDHVYVVADGNCLFQGKGQNLVPYAEAVGLKCPKWHNPADFIIEVASGEHGIEYISKMVELIDNGRVLKWEPSDNEHDRYEKLYNYEHDEELTKFEEEINPNNLKFKCSNFEQFLILFRRASKQIYRNKSYLYIRIYMHIFLGVVIGGLFWQMGNDATKTLFNFGFCFTVIIAFMYIPMMPVLLEFPLQVQSLKREYFNRWYRCNPYFFAMSIAKLPMQMLNTFLYLTIVYLITDQPLELNRIGLFYLVSILTSLTSESFGLLISSRLNVMNGVFIGPVLAVPIMLLSVYGIGSGKDGIPWFIRLCMMFSYLRHSLEGIIQSIYGFNRGDMICPVDEKFCPYKKPEFLLKIMGFEDLDIRVSIGALLLFYISFNLLALLLIKNRLTLRGRNLWPIRIVSRFVKNYLNMVPYS